MAVICPICGTEEEEMCVHEKILIAVKVLLVIIGLWLIYG